jgi:hypothetical protein
VPSRVDVSLPVLHGRHFTPIAQTYMIMRMVEHYRAKGRRTAP